MPKDDKKNLDTRRTTDFIPNQTAPDNWLLFGERSNPLSSKGDTGNSRDYFDYEDQYYDYLESEKKENTF